MNSAPFVSVREVMTPAPEIVDGLATVREAIDRMRDKGVSSVVVDRRERGDEYGLVVIHDVAEHIVDRNRSPDRTNVYEIMSKPVVSVDADMNIKYAARLLYRFGLSRAIVIEDGDLVGLVTLRDLVMRFIAESEQ